MKNKLTITFFIFIFLGCSLNNSSGTKQEPSGTKLNILNTRSITSDLVEGTKISHINEGYIIYITPEYYGGQSGNRGHKVIKVDIATGKLAEVCNTTLPKPAAYLMNKKIYYTNDGILSLPEEAEKSTALSKISPDNSISSRSLSNEGSYPRSHVEHFSYHNDFVYWLGNQEFGSNYNLKLYRTSLYPTSKTVPLEFFGGKVFHKADFIIDNKTLYLNEITTNELNVYSLDTETLIEKKITTITRDNDTIYSGYRIFSTEEYLYILIEDSRMSVDSQLLKINKKTSESTNIPLIGEGISHIISDDNSIYWVNNMGSLFQYDGTQSLQLLDNIFDNHKIRGIRHLSKFNDSLYFYVDTITNGRFTFSTYSFDLNEKKIIYNKKLEDIFDDGFRILYESIDEMYLRTSGSASIFKFSKEKLELIEELKTPDLLNVNYLTVSDDYYILKESNLGRDYILRVPKVNNYNPTLLTEQYQGSIIDIDYNNNTFIWIVDGSMHEYTGSRFKVLMANIDFENIKVLESYDGGFDNNYLNPKNVYITDNYYIIVTDEYPSKSNYNVYSLSTKEFIKTIPNEILLFSSIKSFISYKDILLYSAYDGIYEYNISTNEKKIFTTNIADELVITESHIYWSNDLGIFRKLIDNADNAEEQVFAGNSRELKLDGEYLYWISNLEILQMMIN